LFGGESCSTAATLSVDPLRAKGPADLPVAVTNDTSFAINLKAAKALGLEVPPALLARADEVVE
jgi:ABC-type uncharacterized transport system substrate-binding protein